MRAVGYASVGVAAGQGQDGEQQGVSPEAVVGSHGAGTGSVRSRGLQAKLTRAAHGESDAGPWVGGHCWMAGGLARRVSVAG